MNIDLHIHSTYSDGSMSPTEVVGAAHRLGLAAISLTDHDTIDGIEEAMHVGADLGVEVVPGLELSVTYDEGSVHLLGYFFDRADKRLLEELGRLQEGRKTRNTAILARLNELGIAITERELAITSGHGQSGRPHIASLLVQKGVVGNMDEAFCRYLARGGKAYQPRYVLKAGEAMNIIKDAGGLSVLAHPQQLEKAGKNLSAVIERLRGLGLDGIEAFYPTHSHSFRKRLMAIARRLDLVVSGGSDYHGDIRPGTALACGGSLVPGHLLETMKARLFGSASAQPLPEIKGT
jgi:3',5'-nucleoside bisphosphate phosphatase